MIYQLFTVVLTVSVTQEHDLDIGGEKYYKGIGGEDYDWNHVRQDMVQQWQLVSVSINF